MPRLTVTLGVAFDRATEISVDVDGEFAPDEVFVACNRIDDENVDKLRLAAAWQRELRHLLEVHVAPSMSVGDSFAIDVDGGRRRAHWTCMPHGWAIGTSIPDQPIRRYA